MMNVTVENFDAEVVAASMQLPVLVDFWSSRDDASTVISALLQTLETRYAGRFKLVRIEAEQQPELCQAFGIRSIPTAVLLDQGRPVDGFMGAPAESEVKAFFDKHLPEGDVLEAEVTSEVVTDAPAADDPVAQHEALQQAVLKNPDDEEARFAYIKWLLLAGRDDDAKVALAPVIAKTGLVRRFDSLQRWMNAIDFAAERGDLTGAGIGFDAKIAANKRDFDARFGKAQTLIAAQDWTGAMDELLEILMRDKAWADELARKTYIAILDVIELPPVKVADGQIPPVDPTVATYRRRLSSVILS
jgi:putative thioredoxin